MGIDVTVLGLPILLIDVIVEGKRNGRGKKPPRNKMGYRVFPSVNRIGRPIDIQILLGHYRQLSYPARLRTTNLLIAGNSSSIFPKNEVKQRD